MKKLLILYFSIFCGFLVWAQQQPDFKSLRYNDDFTYLKQDTVKNLYKKAKYIAFNKDNDDYISFGGEARIQYINTVNNKWGDESDAKDGYLLSRYLIHTDLHFKIFRFFTQLQSSLANGLPDPSPVDDNTIDLHQVFLDVNLIRTDAGNATARIGRQEIMYGSQRLISVREGPNSRLSMDGVKLIWDKKDLKTELFYLHPIANIPGSFNDKFNKNAKLWGSYTVVNNVKLINNIDFYYLGIWKSMAKLDNADGKELRHTLGTRIWKNKGDWKYDIEAAYQFGDLAQNKIRAWTVSSNINYTLTEVKLKPVLGLKTEIISGDHNSNDSQIETFNPLYPRGAYFGLVALIGPANLYDIHPSVDLNITEKLAFGTDYDIFWRWSNKDGIYAPNMQLLYSGKDSKESFIGTQLAADFEYTANRFLSFTLEGAWFDTGAFLKKAGSGKDYLYAALTAQFKF